MSKNPAICFFRAGDGELWSGVEVASAEAQTSLTCYRFDPVTRQEERWKDFPSKTSWALQPASHAGEWGKRFWPLQAMRSTPQEDRSAWDRLCALAEEGLRDGKIQKLVPARSVSHELSDLENLSLVHEAATRLFSPAMPESFRFFLARGESIFFGATPELLFKRENGSILVPAIAGTRALTNPDAVSALSEELLCSEKDLHEHRLVVEGILEALKGLGLNPEAEPKPEIIKVPRLLHLFTPIRATDRSDISDEQLMQALHPTPAICGLPRTAAMHLLRSAEGWDRGLFSAPILVRLPEKTLCLVAIRSALLSRQKLHLFAGAGFVSGSTAEGEWVETGKKMEVMKSILFGDLHER